MESKNQNNRLNEFWQRYFVANDSNSMGAVLLKKKTERILLPPPLRVSLPTKTRMIGPINHVSRAPLPPLSL